MAQDLRMSMSTIEDPVDDDATDDEHGYGPEEDDFIPRRETGLRILLTILFLLIAGVIETVLVGVVIFELGAALITQRPPSPRVRELANRIVSYYYKLGRYMTYNESRIPFPFADFPEAVEPDAWRADESAFRALGIPEPGLGSDDEDEDAPA
jgi:hypothetical protein